MVAYCSVLVKQKVESQGGHGFDSRIEHKWKKILFSRIWKDLWYGEGQDTGHTLNI